MTRPLFTPDQQEAAKPCHSLTFVENILLKLLRPHSITSESLGSTFFSFRYYCSPVSLSDERWIPWNISAIIERCGGASARPRLVAATSRSTHFICTQRAERLLHSSISTSQTPHLFVSLSRRVNPNELLPRWPRTAQRPEWRISHPPSVSEVEKNKQKQ